MNKTEQLIRKSMADVKIVTKTELANRIGYTRQRLSYRLDNPSTFTASEIKALGNLFGWSDKDYGEFIRSF